VGWHNFLTPPAYLNFQTAGNPKPGFKGQLNTDPEFINEFLQCPNTCKHSSSRKFQKIINVGCGKKDDPFIGYLILFWITPPLLLRFQGSRSLQFFP